jgi:hypothetical protein
MPILKQMSRLIALGTASRIVAILGAKQKPKERLA